MVILDKPYVSQFMNDTLAKLKIPVLHTDNLKKLTDPSKLNVVDEADFIELAKEQPTLQLYCNSENSIDWILKNLEFTELPRQIEIFKDKVKFRQLIEGLYPDFFYQEVCYQDLAALDIQKIAKPFIIKPAVGFFSMGVYKVGSDEEWPLIVQSIKEEMFRVSALYPKEVMDSSRFIIEECIEGEEYAIDAYYNAEGEPVILDILQHPFSSEKDVSDRVYITSRHVIAEHLTEFEALLQEIGSLAKLANFPAHIEVRVAADGRIIPIEVNPVRFAGWCVTDIAHFAYGINVYEYFFEQKKPDWEAILAKGDERIYSMVLADLPKDIRVDDIEGFNYERYVEQFSCLLELRKIDYREYPVFGFAYICTDSGSDELDRILRKDLREYVVLKG